MPYVLGAFLLVLLVSGGASRADEPHQILARLGAIAVIAVAALSIRPDQLRQVRAPLLFLTAVVALMAVQLIPLPPGLWVELPGRALYQEGLALAGLEPVWRPLTLTPDRTLNALLALLPAIAAALALAMLDRRQHQMLAIGLIIFVLISALVGIVQLSTGLLYFYRISNEGSAVGVLANRNHHAALIAAIFPVLAAWAAAPTADRNFAQLRSVLALLAATLLVAMLLAAGSRAGLLLGAFGAILAMVILWFGEVRGKGGSARMNWKLALPLLLGAVAVAASLYFARDLAFQRLIGEGSDGIRQTLRPTFLQMIADFMPIGSGFGSFDPAFRIYEPDWNLSPAYVNHVHNDYFEVLLEAGLAGGALMAVFLIWFAVRLWTLWYSFVRGDRDGSVLLGVAGSVIVFILLAASAVDYPLRTPTMSFVFTLAAMWMLPMPPASRASKTKLGTRRPNE